MIDAEKIREALLNNQGLIRAAQRDWQAAYTIQTALLNAIGVQSSDAVIQKLQENGYEGHCWPTAELDQHHSLFINLFPEDFSNADALQWAEKTLKGTSTFAVHTAFIPPKKGSIPPIGAINIGWAYHPRRPEQEKMAGSDLKILIGDDLLNTNGQSSAISSQQADMHQFTIKMSKIQETMATSGKSGIICFFEGSFLPPSYFSPYWREKFQSQVEQILSWSGWMQIPVVAISQNINTQNLAGLASHFGKQHQDRFISDADLINAMMPPFSRTVLFSINQEVQEETKITDNQLLSEGIIFLYFLPPAGEDVIRIELPNWLLTSSKHNHVLNNIIAEYILGRKRPLTLSIAANQAEVGENDKNLFLELC